jgi:hypothetical protein
MEAEMSSLTTCASTEASVLRTRFVIVNDRVPRAKAICAICGRKIETGYVRESQTRLFYCDTKCVPEYAKLTMIPVKTHAREVS